MAGFRPTLSLSPPILPYVYEVFSHTGRIVAVHEPSAFYHHKHNPDSMFSMTNGFVLLATATVRMFLRLSVSP